MIEQHLRNIVISGFGNTIRKENDLVTITTKDGEKIYFSPHEVEQVIIAGESSITSGVVRLLLENGTDLVFIEHKPTNFFARVIRNDYNMITDLWRRQMTMSKDRRIEIAKEILNCAIYNKIRVLQSLAKNISIDFSKEIGYLDNRREDLTSETDDEGLMGIEGNATRRYFDALKRIIPKELGFEKRERHPPRDPVNSMLSYGYTVLRSRVEYGLMRAGLNPFEGILHVAYRGRPVLSFDLMEEFRQPIVDRVVITMIMQKQVAKNDFDLREDMCYMSDGVRKRFLEALYSRFEVVYIFHDEKLSFLDIIFEQAKILANAIKNDEKYDGFRYR